MSNSRSFSINNNPWQLNRSNNIIENQPLFQKNDTDEFSFNPKHSESVTVQQIFDDSEKTEKAISMSPKIETPLNISAEKRKELSTNFKRFRRKSMLPKFEELDKIDDEEEDDEETEDEQEAQPLNDQYNDALSVRVCEEHRTKALGVESFEYSCTKCHCFCSEDELLRYTELLEMADKAEREQNNAEALQFLMEALEISNQDIAVHQRCSIIGSLLFQ